MSKKSNVSINVFFFRDATYADHGLIFSLCLMLALSASNVLAASSQEVLSNDPVVINTTFSVSSGDIVGIQGEGFGDAPTVSLEGVDNSSDVNLPLVNKFGQGWLTFRLPDSVMGALVLHINNGKLRSKSVKLNAARGYHLDALQIVPLGAFHIFGRNLISPGYKPSVMVDGLAANVDLNSSNEHMLTVTAPLGLSSTRNSMITVDNGNGTGVSIVDRKIEVIVGSSGDPFALGVGWAAGFSRISSRVFNVVNDSRLTKKVLCNEDVDGTNSLQGAIDQVAASGGGVLQLPAGICRLAGTLKLKSNVVIQGAGKNRTYIKYEGNYALWGRGVDLSGVRALTMMNARGPIESPLLQDSTRVFFQDVKFILGGGKHMFLTNNKNFVVMNSDFIQSKNMPGYGPYTFAGCSGMVFVGNVTTFADGGTAFPQIHDSYIFNNHFTRDIKDNQNSKSVVHSFAMDFAYRIAVVGNIFDVIGGPIVNKSRNDGETLLTEGGGGRRTENIGTVAFATTDTLSDPSNAINVTPFSIGVIPENYGVAIVGGRGAGQTRQVIAYSKATLTVDRPWDVIPDATSHYATFVWGLEKSLIKENKLSQNSRGIWLYQTAVREVDIVKNIIDDGGGIYLRSVQSLKDKLFVPIYGLRIQDNIISNATREWPSYINVSFVRRDASDFGIGTIGVEIRNNFIKANRPNLSLINEESGTAEGYINMMRLEVEYKDPSNQTRLLGTIFQNNTCVDCDVGFKVRDGARGTVQDGDKSISSPLY